MRRVVAIWLPHFSASLAPVVGQGPLSDRARATVVASHAGNIVHRCAPWVEFFPGAMDELLADLGPGAARDGLEMCRRIAGELDDELGLRSYIALATGKLTAHAAARVAASPSAERQTSNILRSTLHAPRSPVIEVPEGRERDFLAPLAVETLWDLGDEAARQLRRRGITTLGQLAALPEVVVRRHLGPAAPVLQRLAAGQEQRRVAEWTPAPSEAAVALLGSDEPLPEVLERLAARLARRLRGGDRCQVISMALHLTGGRRLFAAEPLGEAVPDITALCRVAARLLERLQPRVTALVLAELEAGFKLQTSGWASAMPFPAFKDLYGAVLTGRPLPVTEPQEIGVEALELAVSALNPPRPASPVAVPGRVPLALPSGR